MSDSSEAQRWKQKYFKSLDQLDDLEKKEQQWGELEALLQKAITRLGVAATGQDDRLDNHISDIRNATRNQVNPAVLSDALEGFSSHLATLRENTQAQPPTPVGVMLDLVEQLQVPPELRAAKALLRNQLNAVDLPATELAATVADFFHQAWLELAQRQAEQVLSQRNAGDVSTTTPRKAVVAEAAESRPSGLLSRLGERWRRRSAAANTEVINANDAHRSSAVARGKGVSKPAAEMVDRGVDQNVGAPDAASTIAAKAMAEETSTPAGPHRQNIEHATATSQASGRRSTDANPAGEVGRSEQPSASELLIRLLEQLSVPADQQADVDALKQRLAGDGAASDWRVLLQDVAQLINSIRNTFSREKQEFEVFLHQITERLQEIGEYVNVEQAALADAEQASVRFSAKMSSNVDSIRKDMGAARDLDSLKKALETNLNVLYKDVVDYREIELQRARQAEHSMAALRTKMNTMEENTTLLKREVETSNQKALVDTLTNIPNRLSLENRVEQEIARWQQSGESLSLVIWDIDHFKNINDTYGHAAGDNALKAIAQLLNENTRQTDFLARYGGEEFVMLLPGTGQDEALRVANTLRERVAGRAFQYRDEAVSIKVSCGISCFRDGDDLQTVFERADKALYRAKAEGRNRCELG